MEDIIGEAQKLSADAQAKGTFNIVNVLLDRGYPTRKLVVCINEQAAYDYTVLRDEIDALEGAVTAGNADAVALQEELVERQGGLVKLMQDSAYTFHLMGFSEGLRNDIIDEAEKKFPVEFKENRDILGNVTDTERVPSPARDAMVTDRFWHEAIRKIVSPDGAVQENITVADVSAMRKILPLSAVTKINEAVEQLRIATSLFLLEVNEDFLAKP